MLRAMFSAVRVLLSTSVLMLVVLKLCEFFEPLLHLGVKRRTRLKTRRVLHRFHANRQKRRLRREARQQIGLVRLRKKHETPALDQSRQVARFKRGTQQIQV